jgi:chromosome segregation ATPase
MQQVKFENQTSIEENDTVTTVLKDVKAFVRPLEFLSRDLSRVREQIGEVKDKFKDLKNESDHSIATSRKANEIGRKIKDGKFSAKIGVLDTKASDMQENMEEAIELNKKIPGLVNNLTESYANLGVSVENVKELQAPLSDKVEKLLDELRLNENTVSQSQNHARQMKYEADGLQGMLDRTKAYSDNAIAAATSYEKIVDSLEDALASAEKGSSNADSATEIINNLHSSELVEPSRNQLVQAENYLRQVEYDLKIPLRDAKSTIDTIEGANNITSYSLNNVQKELDKIESPNDMSDLDKAITDSTSATKRTQETQDNIKDILENLPTYTNSLRKLRLGLTDLNSGTGSSDRECKLYFLCLA